MFRRPDRNGFRFETETNVRSRKYLTNKRIKRERKRERERRKKR